MTGELEPVALTDAQRGKFLDVLRADKYIGNVAALRAAGVQGTKRDLRDLIDDELLEQAREARGWSLLKVENCTWEVATNPEHPSWDRANARVLKAYHPAYRDQARVDVNHSGEVRNPDVAEAVERLNALVAAAALRSSAGNGPRELPSGTD